jgi:hypothetical protein
MTGHVPPIGRDPRALDLERELEAYAASVQIVASGPLLRRIHASVAEERAAAGAGALARLRERLRGGPARARVGVPAATGLRTAGALARPSLVMLLLLVMALGATVGGAGAVIVSLVDRTPAGPTDPVHRVVPGPTLPAPNLRRSVVAPDPSLRDAEARTPAPVPALTVSVQPQRRPGPSERGEHGRIRSRGQGARRLRPASFPGVTGTAGRMGCEPTGHRDPSLQEGTLVLPRPHVARCSF